MKVGLACHATLGGSGVIATGLGHALARAGHDVHFFCADVPPRLDLTAPNVTLHRVASPVHALFPGGEYALALASKLAEVAARERLDVLHVHYAIPHATSAFLARAMLGPQAPRLVTTLHGTDVLTLGVDPALHPVLKHSVLASDALTVPTRFLRDEVQRNFGPHAPVDVIGNFVDTERFRPAAVPPARPPTLIHSSSFRPLKRIDDVVRIFARVRARLPEARLLLVGDGPARPEIEALAAELGVAQAVSFLGEQADLVPLLQQADVFVFPSETESFGLAALEAFACGVPVVASRTGGLPELIDEGVTGFLRPVGDVPALADAVLALLGDRPGWGRMSAAAREVAERWKAAPRVAEYEAVYRRVLARGT